MYTYPFFSIFWYSVVMVLFCFSPSLPFLDSLSMAPKRKPTPSQNPLRSRASSSILLLFTFGFVMKRPVRTSWRTSPNVAFIQNAAWFYRTFFILLYPCHSQSRMGIPIWDTRELSHHDHIGVLLQYAWFRYLYTSDCYAGLRYTYCSHSRAHFRDTTCSAGFTS